MRRKDLCELKKNKKPQQIIYMHIHNQIYLTDMQINELIKKRDKHHKRKAVVINE